MNKQTAVFRAPWATSVKAVSIGATVLLLAISLVQAMALPRNLLGGWPWWIGVVLPWLLLLGCALFVVRGYSLETMLLRVQRLLWQTDLPLESLERAWASPEAMSGSWRLFGNGGLYAITGIFRNARLGNYRAFAMDPKRAVVLVFASRTVVISPESPDAFLGQLRLCCPGVTIGQPGAEV